MKQEEKIQIIVATHKPYEMPKDPVYLPLLVGAEINHLSWNGRRDNEGDNISAKNPNYCELTGLYWAWKNLKADYIGLVHYRRLFADSRCWEKKTERILKEKELRLLLDQTDILLPKPRHYWVETNYSQYAHAHHKQDLDTTRQILKSKYPEYLSSFDKVMKKRSGHRFNMLIMKKEILNYYCEWLFDLLEELEYTFYDRRVFGFVGERLLDVWIETKRPLFKNIPYVFIEKQNWIKKGADFIRRKFDSKS